MAEHFGELNTGKFMDARSLDVKSQHLMGRYRTIRERKTADFAQNDTLLVAKVPSHAVFSHAISRLRWSALGASCTLGFGFKEDLRPIIKAASDDGEGVTGMETALAAGIDAENAGEASAMGAVAIGDEGKYAWELAGLDRDPGVDLWLIVTVGGANPPSGTVAIEQGYVTD